MNPTPPAPSCPPKTQSAAADSSVEATVAGFEQHEWFDAQLRDHHYLGAGRPVGDYLRQIVTVRGRPAALLVWGPACYALKDRDEWIGWGATMRVERLKLVVQNRRFLLLSDKGAAPNLASQTMAAALRALPAHWLARFGYRPLLAESFTYPESYAGTCYKASNWEPVGFSAGFGRHRADFYVPNDRPKRLRLYPLAAKARAQLCAAEPPADCRAGILPAPTGTLPLTRPQMESLLEVFRRAPDPRGKSVQYRIGAVLTIVAMTLLAGRREFSQFARFAQSLPQPQRQLLGLPRKKGCKAFWQVPSYSVFYDVLTRLDADAFAVLLVRWLQAHAGQLPSALALDGKMIRDHLGVLALVDHDDGAPQTLALYDQKEGTTRCELTAATALLSSLPALDGKIVTADALHCQRATARTIVEKGGEYCLQIKANQPSLLDHARKLDALPDTPFCPDHQRPRPARTPCPPRLRRRSPAPRLPLCPQPDRRAQPGRRHQDRATNRRIPLLPLQPAARRTPPAQWHALIRGHWAGVEIRNHWRSDAVWGEDHSRTRNPTALANLALLRSALIALLARQPSERSLPELIESPPATTIAPCRRQLHFPVLTWGL